ncbi:hypothetical protein GCM10008018_46330 [Paenibacillus marchantiophytorum]|uniref:Uncharacterized protein n=1 Tax=Paenibacillus marchantiophytorum TaxID=1619310 RepID=A0ABQ1EZP7_9BACL|nr:hypothetical protein GCM10008018_46330 [Paenibacillus marchantiophytorum]
MERPYSHLKLNRNEEEGQRLKFLIREIRSILDSKVRRPILQKMKSNQSQTWPRAWDCSE